MVQRIWVAIVGLLASHCVDDVGPLDSPCGPSPSWECMAPGVHACAPWALAAPVCEGVTWLCPAGGARYVANDVASACRPGPSDPPPSTFGALVEFEGGCAVLVDHDVPSRTARVAPRVARLPQPPELGTCALGETLAFDWVRSDGLDAADLVDLDDVAWTAQGPLAVQRLFRRAPEALFGVEAVGGSVVRAQGQGVSAPKPPHYDSHGYRSLAVDGDFVFQFDCFGAPDDLLEDCGVLRAPLSQAEDPNAYRWRLEDGTYDREPVGRQVVFRAGPQHHVAFHPGLGRWVMVSVAGFGDTIFARTALHPEGPWSAAVDLYRCPWPDDGAFCDSARLVPALLDPGRPTQLVLTYRMDTLAENKAALVAANPDAYRATMIRVELSD